MRRRALLLGVALLVSAACASLYAEARFNHRIIHRVNYRTDDAGVRAIDSHGVVLGDHGPIGSLPNAAICILCTPLRVAETAAWYQLRPAGSKF